MITTYKLRCKLSKCNAHDIHKYIKSISNQYCYVVEKLDENPHMHWYIETTTLNPTIRKQLRALCGAGNGGYSLKSVTKHPIEYLAYMQKENTVTYFNIPPEIITEANAYQLKVATEIAAKKAAKKSLLTTLLELCQDIDYTHFDFSIAETLKIVMDYHREHNLIYRKYQIQSYTQTILIRYSPSYEMYYKCKIMEDLKD